MNIFDRYQTNGSYGKPFLRGIRDAHFWTEREVEDVNSIQILGAAFAFSAYVTVPWYLFSIYGLKGLLPLAIPVVTNLHSYRRQRERERRIREIGEP